MGAVPPFLLKTPDNPNGNDAAAFEGIMAAIREDRAKFFEEFGKTFYGVGMLKHPVSDALLRWSQSLVLQAGLKPTLDCVRAFGFTDFRQDMAAFTVPTLVQHGDADQIVPIDISGRLSARMIPGATFKVYEGAPHGLFATHTDEVNAVLLAFLQVG